MKEISNIIYNSKRVVCDFVVKGENKPYCHGYNDDSFTTGYPRYFMVEVTEPTMAEKAVCGEGRQYINVCTVREIEEKAAKKAAELKEAEGKKASEKASLDAFVNEENLRLEAIASGKELSEINEIDLRRLWTKIGSTWVVQFQTALIFGKSVPVTEGATKFK